jgi:hypothetical protein
VEGEGFLTLGDVRTAKAALDMQASDCKDDAVKQAWVTAAAHFVTHLTDAAEMIRRACSCPMRSIRPLWDLASSRSRAASAGG